MIPGLWQCDEPTWWEHLLSFPLSGYGLITALALEPAFQQLGWRAAEKTARKAFLWQFLTMAAFTVLGVLAGITLMLTRLDPSAAYSSMRALWIGSGWLVVAGVVANQWKELKVEHHDPNRTHAEGAALQASIKKTRIWWLAVVALFVWRNAWFQPVTFVRGFVHGVFDLFSAQFATNECLGERVIDYLSFYDYGDRIDPRVGIGGTAEMALSGRHLTSAQRVAAMQSYRRKVAHGLIPEPKTLYGLRIIVKRHAHRPDVAAELDAWEREPGFSDKLHGRVKYLRRSLDKEGGP